MQVGEALEITHVSHFVHSQHLCFVIFLVRDLGQPTQPTNNIFTYTCRVFHDRLINNEDKEYFKKMLVELMGKHSLGGGSYDDLFVNRNIMFGDFLRMGVDREDRKYEEVTDQPKLNQVIHTTMGMIRNCKGFQNLESDI